MTIDQDTATFPDLAIGGNGTATVDYTFSVDAGVACGTLLQFALQVDYTGFSGPESR